MALFYCYARARLCDLVGVHERVVFQLVKVHVTHPGRQEKKQKKKKAKKKKQKNQHTYTQKKNWWALHFPLHWPRFRLYVSDRLPE